MIDPNFLRDEGRDPAMDNVPILPTPDEGEGGPSPSTDDVMISRKELDDLRSRAGALTPAVEAAGPAEGSLDPRGREAQLTREFAERDQRLVELERTCKAAVRDRELATALAGKPLAAGAASQLIRLWREDFDAYEEGGGYKVAAKDGRSVGQVVNDWLASPEYSHFCLPTSRGGTGARDASRPSGPTALQTAPRNLGESIVMRWREESAAKPGNLLKPIGLRRHR